MLPISLDVGFKGDDCFVAFFFNKVHDIFCVHPETWGRCPI